MSFGKVLLAAVILTSSAACTSTDSPAGSGNADENNPQNQASTGKKPDPEPQQTKDDTKQPKFTDRTGNSGNNKSQNNEPDNKPADLPSERKRPEEKKQLSELSVPDEQADKKTVIENQGALNEKAAPIVPVTESLRANPNDQQVALPEIDRTPPKELWRMFSDAVETDDGDMAERLLQVDKNLTRKKLGFFNRDTFTHIAASRGSANVIRAIGTYAREALKDQDWNGNMNTPAYLAASMGHANVVHAMAQSAKDLFPELFNAKMYNGSTPVEAAVENGHANVIRAIWQYAPELLKERNNALFKYTPACWAAVYGQVEIIHVLAQYVFESLGERCKGGTPVHLAAFKGHANAIHALWQYAPESFKQKDKEGYTPAHWAAENGDPGSVRALAKYAFATFTEKNNSGETPFDILRKKGNDALAGEMEAQLQDAEKGI